MRDVHAHTCATFLFFLPHEMSSVRALSSLVSSLFRILYMRDVHAHTCATFLFFLPHEMSSVRALSSLVSSTSHLLRFCL